MEICQCASVQHVKDPVSFVLQLKGVSTCFRTSPLYRLSNLRPYTLCSSSLQTAFFLESTNIHICSLPVMHLSFGDNISQSLCNKRSLLVLSIFFSALLYSFPRYKKRPLPKISPPELHNPPATTSPRCDRWAVVSAHRHLPPPAAVSMEGWCLLVLGWTESTCTY